MAHLLLVSISTLSLMLACMRTEDPSAESAAGSQQTIRAAEYFTVDPQSDDALANARRMDQAGRTPDGQLALLSPKEHMRRATTYHVNRAFAEAREHWQALIARFPEDADVPAAMFGIGRSLFQERRYAEALPIFQKLGDSYPQTEAGRDGFYYVAATLLRMERAGEAAERYAEYVARFPQGERIENAYLNIIDSFREAGRHEDAIVWVARTRERFRGMPAATNALFARLRLDVARGDWQTAARTSDELMSASLARGVQTTMAEVAYLKAYSLERAGQKEAASRIYQTIPDRLNSYYGGLATARLMSLGGASKAAATERAARVRAETLAARNDYPAPYRETILRASAKRRVDPRLMLAIMRQESGFRPGVKSNSAARGLMQFVMDVALKYAPEAGLNNLQDEDLYRPEVSIQLAAAYLSELSRLFPGLPEAVAASYNGGEDNVARWVKRAVHPDAGVVASEVGFSESKDYVFKVMANYRAYRQLYTEDLQPRR